MNPAGQLPLFQANPAEPEGFAYAPELISAPEERALADQFAALPFAPFEFRGHLGNRRVVSFGWRYDFNGGGLKPTQPIPGFLEPLRARAAGLLGAAPEALEQVLVTEYQPGAGIGWHRDRPEFGEVAGVSLVSPCVFRFRRRRDERWERFSFGAEPRSGYRLTGEARTVWEHSILAVDTLRY